MTGKDKSFDWLLGRNFTFFAWVFIIWSGCDKTLVSWCSCLLSFFNLHSVLALAFEECVLSTALRFKLQTSGILSDVSLTELAVSHPIFNGRTNNTSHDQPVYKPPFCLKDVDLFSLGLLIILCTCFQSSTIISHHLVALMASFQPRAFNTLRHITITRGLAKQPLHFCGDLLHHLFFIAGHIWLLSIANMIERLIMSLAKNLTKSSWALEDTLTSDTPSPNETAVTDQKSASKARWEKIQDGGTSLAYCQTMPKQTIVHTVWQSHTTISKETLRRWTKETLSTAGVDMDRFKSHSRRSSSTSWAMHKEVSVDKVMAAAAWRSSDTFAQFYKWPIVDRSKDVDWALVQSTTTPKNRYNSTIHTTITVFKVLLVPPTIGWDIVNKLNELTVKFNWDRIPWANERTNALPLQYQFLSLSILSVSSYVVDCLVYFVLHPC